MAVVCVFLSVPTAAHAWDWEVVAPSGDVTGETDADAIEDALRSIGEGGTVLLSDGKWWTVDRYYTDRVVVVDGFSGTLRGEGKYRTWWTAVANDVEAYLYDSDYIVVDGVPDAGVWATALHLEFPGDWTLRDLTMVADDPVDASEAPGGYFQNVAAWGGDGDNTIKNAGFKATDATTAAVFGPHVMRGSTRGGADTTTDGVGDTRVSGCTFNNQSDGPVIMWFDASKIVVKHNVFVDVGAGVYLEGFVDSTAKVEGNLFIRGGRAVGLFGTPHTTIEDNVIYGADAGGNWWLSPIGIFYGTTDVAIRGNGFFEIANVDLDGTAPDGAGAVHVWQGGGNDDITIEGNHYGAMAVAIRSYVDGVEVCEPRLADDQVVGADNPCSGDH